MHYTKLDYEKNRLSATPFGQLEWYRTRLLLKKHLPPASAGGFIVDCGGATGEYTAHLARCGFAVHLVDLTPLHVETARENLKKAGLLEEDPELQLEENQSRETQLQPQPRPGHARASVGNALALSSMFEPESADAVLLMGPLYHLQAEADRVQALKETMAVLKPGGVLIAAAISRFASLIDGLLEKECIFDADGVFADVVRHDLESGQHHNPEPEGHPEWFTDSYFMRPEELRELVCRVGFTEPDTQVIAVEGPVWVSGSARFKEQWESERKRSLLLEMLLRVEKEESMLGVSPHLLCVAEKPRDKK